MVTGFAATVNVFRLHLSEYERWRLVEHLESALNDCPVGSRNARVLADLLGQLVASPDERYELVQMVVV